MILGVDRARRLHGWVVGQIFERLRLHGLVFLRDGLVVMAAYSVGEAIRFSGWPSWQDLHWFVIALPFLAAMHLIFNYRFGIHRRIWEYVGTRDLRAMTQACLLSGGVLFLIDISIRPIRLVPLSVVPVGAGLALLGLLGVRFWREVVGTSLQSHGDRERLLIVGAGHAAHLVVADLLANPRSPQRPVGFVDDDPKKQLMQVHGLPVLGTIEDLPALVAKHKIDLIGVAITRASAVEVDRIVALAQQTSARIQILPSPGEAMATKTPLRLRDINLDDLLDRDPGSVLDDPNVRACIEGKCVLVTGARGSIGFELCRQVLRLNPSRLIALDNNETGLFYLLRELRDDPNAHLISPTLADITNVQRLQHIFQRFRPDVVFHAAAYKHVPLLETFPEEAVLVNVMGTLNLCKLASEYGVDRFVFISTDKAVSPVNVLGYSKRIGELLVRAHSGGRTIFCSVRFGNVIGSRGSALPEFVYQIDAGGPVSVTHPEVERYFMTIAEAVGLVILAGAEASSAELYMLDMGKPIRIADLVHRMIRLRGLRVGKDIEMTFSGLRPGEKITEDLIYDGEHMIPTTHPSVFQIADPVVVDLVELEQAVRTLRDAAHAGEERLLERLQAVARGDPFGPRLRLTSRR